MHFAFAFIWFYTTFVHEHTRSPVSWWGLTAAPEDLQPREVKTGFFKNDTDT